MSPNYRYKITFNAVNPQREAIALEAINRILNMGLDLSYSKQGNKYTFTIDRRDGALTLEEAKFELIQDLYQEFFEGINDVPNDEELSPLDELLWSIKDIDIKEFTNNMTVELL